MVHVNDALPQAQAARGRLPGLRRQIVQLLLESTQAVPHRSGIAVPAGPGLEMEILPGMRVRCSHKRAVQKYTFLITTRYIPTYELP